LQPLDGVGDVGVQRRGHQQDAVAEGAELLTRAHRHRDLGDERHVRQVLVLDQPPPHRARAGADDDVVDRRAVLVLGGLEVLERELPEREPPVRRDPAGELRLGCDEVRAVDAVAHEPRRQARDGAHAGEDAERGLVEVRDRLRQPLDHPDRVARQAEQPEPEHLQRRRRRVREVVLRIDRTDLTAFGRQVEQQRHDLRAAQPVDHGVVDLRQHRDEPGLVALDDVDLPQRPRAVERAGHDPRDLVGELGVVARRGERHLTHVVAEVDLGLLDPVGMVEPERDVREPPPQRRELRAALGQQPRHLEAAEDAVRRRRRVEHRKTADVPRLAWVLKREELRVEAGQLPHARTLSSRGPPTDT
jgi:hypothetical protein